MSEPEAAPDDRVGDPGGADHGTPRWVKVFGAIALVVIVLFIVLAVFGDRGGHGPRRHAVAPAVVAPR